MHPRTGAYICLLSSIFYPSHLTALVREERFLQSIHASVHPSQSMHHDWNNFRTPTPTPSSSGKAKPGRRCVVSQFLHFVWVTVITVLRSVNGRESSMYTWG
ncbi:hypothetical protein BDW22DRAFT_830194 [Trametopsis cervina]|nr:hypothetical protein BDW22DRAFT_830194 [Trametopsis cervina]